ncbi:hypothetical protein ZOSMA_3G01160 [Zostera marina]|uniref:Ubiquitin-like domain-containing protein n=1 Tax=Zostera marina TaxID=29655 RepID=A0A0K9P3T6_ZOSMR|nr:hypothetical protein ZOSMA_3G01160 [Zostera marina]
MADGSNSSPPIKASGDVASSSEEGLVNINIKTLDSNIFSFRVDKTKPVSLLKETIAGAVGVPAEQQRLIFKGKVLKDDQHLSVYRIFFPNIFLFLFYHLPYS